MFNNSIIGSNQNHTLNKNSSQYTKQTQQKTFENKLFIEKYDIQNINENKFGLFNKQKIEYSLNIEDQSDNNYNEMISKINEKYTIIKNSNDMNKEDILLIFNPPKHSLIGVFESVGSDDLKFYVTKYGFQKATSQTISPIDIDLNAKIFSDIPIYFNSQIELAQGEGRIIKNPKYNTINNLDDFKDYGSINIDKYGDFDLKYTRKTVQPKNKIDYLISKNVVFKIHDFTTDKLKQNLKKEGKEMNSSTIKYEQGKYDCNHVVYNILMK